MNKKPDDDIPLTVEQHENSDVPELDEAELNAMHSAASTNEWSKTYTTSRKEIPGGLWERCPGCHETIFVKARTENLQICPKCGHYHPMSAPERIALLSDEGSFVEIDKKMRSVDTLKFEGTASYIDKLESNMKKTGLKDAVVCGTCTLDGKPYALGVMDFRFLGASMGSVVGEKIVRLTELATKKGIPLVLATASGGARMYEGMLSLMQMAKTSGALHRHAEAGLPYVVIMTHPTYAGVTASFASLGDLILAEPKAMIGFAGPRVIKDTTQSQLPEGFQSSEFLLDKGLIDRIIPRGDLREELSLVLDFFAATVQPQQKATKSAPKAKAKAKPVKKTVTKAKTATATKAKAAVKKPVATVKKSAASKKPTVTKTQKKK